MENAHGTALLERPAPRTLPTPPDFPVRWERPEDALIFWTRDIMHYSGQMTPLDGSFLRRFADHGFNDAMERVGGPIRAQMRRFNTYYYQAYVPVTTDPEELAAIGARLEPKISAAMGSFGDDWRNEFLPEIKRYVADWETFDLRGATLPELIAHFETSIARTDRLMFIHFMVGMPMLMGMSLFDEFYRDLFGADDAFGAFKLQQGFSNKTIEANNAAWWLSRLAFASKAVRRVFETEAAAGVLAALDKSAEGRAFRTHLDAYLQEYGKRGNTWFLLAETPWIEDPTPLIRTLKDYVTLPDRDPKAEMAALAAERELLLAEARARLQGFPEVVQGEFEFLLKAAQTGTMLQEDHNFWIDYRSTYHLRCVIFELARRFVAAGMIEERSDIVYLTLDDIRTTAKLLPMNLVSPLIAERKAEMERFRTVQPPSVLGTEPPGAPPDDPINRAMGKFFGGPPPVAIEADVLKGNPGSPGVVRGRAKVLRSLADAGKLERGDILVSETTAPPWTPLFATAAAVVTDTGGILSHCAVVAREYAIPAVVGTGMATARIHDGQWLEVDGNLGTVRILSE
jgi:phosphohistidine swiveling domain-containing protein